MDTDEGGDMPKWLKWLVGGVAFLGAVALTAMTGGALAPVFVGMGASVIGGGVIQGAISAANGGSFMQGFADGAADGALWGGVFALASSSVSAIKALQTAKRGITIGKNMDKVRLASQVTDSAVYKPMKGYKVIKSVFGKKFANKLSIYHNKVFINRMIKLDAVIYDSGLNGAKSAGLWYGMELNQLAKARYNTIKLF